MHPGAGAPRERQDLVEGIKLPAVDLAGLQTKDGPVVQWGQSCWINLAMSVDRREDDPTHTETEHSQGLFDGDMSEL